MSGKVDAITAGEIASIVMGPDLFPSRPTGLISMLGLSGQRERQDDMCFSICLKNDTTLNLEIPPDGNGRSREEWVSALRSLVAGRIGALFGLDSAGGGARASGHS